MSDPVTFGRMADNLQPLLASKPLIRAVNFHNTSRARAAEYDQQLAHYASAFSPVNEDDLDQYLVTGRWHKAKPGLIAAFYNGYRDNYDVIVPMLERYGLTGWFFVATAFVSTPAADQTAFAALQTLRTVKDEYPDGRYALSWAEVKEIDRRHHVIASHTRSHSKLAAANPNTLSDEIVGPQHDFEANLGHRVRSFASLSGAAYGEQQDADSLIEAAGYHFVFSNYKIQRVRATSQK